MTAAFVAFAKFEFELDKDVDGATQREHLQALWERSGVMPKTLANAPRCPSECRHLWNAFTDLRASVPSGFGIGRISYSELDAYQRVTGSAFAPWEVDAIRRIDRELVIARAKK